MTEHGLYIIKHDFLELISSIGGDCDIQNGDRRPVYCCIKDRNIEGLYWAVPTSDLSHRSAEQNKKYNKYISLPERDLRSCYYHIGRTTRPALFKISSCYPITEKYIDHEYISCNVHVVIRRSQTVNEIERKLKRILAFESRNKNYFAQHISDIREYLLKELLI